MSGDLDRLLRGVVADLAAEGRAVDLSRPALRAARRVRARRVAAAAVTAVVLVIGLTFAVVRVGRTEQSLPPVGTVPSSAEPWPTATVPHSRDRRPLLLPDWEVRGVPTATGVLVFDDAQKRYRPVRVPGGVASPDGRWVVGVDAGRLRIHEVAAGRDVPHELPGAAPDVVPAWSADSTKVAYAAVEGMVIIVDLVLMTQVRGTTMPCSAGCDLRVQGEVLHAFHDGSFTGLNLADGSPTAQRPQPLNDPCPQRRSYRFDITYLSPQAIDRIDGPFQIWACLTAGAFELRTETGKLIETTPIPTEIDGHRVEPDPARLTLYQWPGCTPDEKC